MKYQVILIAEDGEYIQEEFRTEIAAYNYLVANRCHYGDGQQLVIRPVPGNNFYY